MSTPSTPCLPTLLTELSVSSLFSSISLGLSDRGLGPKVVLHTSVHTVGTLDNPI